MNSRKGFSLIEILIAFTVLTITVVSATTLLSSSIQNNQENILRLQAYNLSQEGLEATRNIRDSNWMQNLNFATETGEIWGGVSIYPARTDSVSFTVDPIFNASSSTDGAAWTLRAATSESSKLYLNESLEGIKSFTHIGGEDTPFRRIVKVEKYFDQIEELKVNEATESIDENLMLVTSTVFYEFRGNEKEIALTTILTDWKQGPL